MENTSHTPGPWSWYGSPKTGFYLATVNRGREYVMGFRRLGMNQAQPVFKGNGRLVPAKELCVFEVEPDATSADDPRVYRQDIIGFRSADARLIAAAPELYSALKLLVDGANIGITDFDAAVDRAREALAKAEGRPPSTIEGE